MHIQNHKAYVALLSLAFIAPSGCNTTTGALSGAGIGAGIGALVARKNPLAGAAIGAGVGALAGGIIGHINEEQKEKLQQQSPQTLKTIKHNDAVAAAANPNNTSAGAPANPAPASPSNNPSVASNPPPAAAPDKPIPLGVDDIKAMSSSGIKEDVICSAITESQAVYRPQDIAAVQSATPPIDPKVIDCMKQHATS